VLGWAAVKETYLMRNVVAGIGATVTSLLVVVGVVAASTSVQPWLFLIAVLSFGATVVYWVQGHYADE
jgi:hypothetical protein